MEDKSDYRPVIFVTGCSSGIGLALAHLLWKEDLYRVVITARRQSFGRLAQEGLSDNSRFLVRPLDVTSDTERRALMDEIIKKWGGVNILINNAGISYRSVIEHMDVESEFEQMNVNYLSPMALIRLVLPGMRERGRGKIINVSSVSGMLAMPTMGSYSASKYALEGASESLWYEMQPLGINVTLIQPGFVKSKSFLNVYHSKASHPRETASGPYCDYYSTMTPFIEKMMERSLTTPEKIARLILKVIKKNNPPLRVAATLDAFIFYYLRRFLPRQLFHRILFLLLPGARHWGENYSKARHKTS